MPLLRPIITTPTLSSSRFNAMALVPFSNSTSSPLLTPFKPYIRAIPSPTCNTVPTSSKSAEALKLLNCCLRIADISSGLMSTINTYLMYDCYVNYNFDTNSLDKNCFLISNKSLLILASTKLLSNDNTKPPIKSSLVSVVNSMIPN